MLPLVACGAPGEAGRPRHDVRRIPDPAPAEQVAQAQAAGDAALASQAQAALQQDKDLQALPLTVSTAAGGVVVVKGAAPTPDLAQKAIKLVQALPGVKEVRNEIKVG